MRKPNGKIRDESVARRMRRKLTIRKKINGTAERPRLCAIKTNKHLRVLVVDDEANKVLFSVQTFGKNAVDAKNNREGAKKVGQAVAEAMKKNNFGKAVFDRNGFIYAGVLSDLADSIRENGINI